MVARRPPCPPLPIMSETAGGKGKDMIHTVRSDCKVEHRATCSKCAYLRPAWSRPSATVRKEGRTTYKEHDNEKPEYTPAAIPESVCAQEHYDWRRLINRRRECTAGRRMNVPSTTASEKTESQLSTLNQGRQLLIPFLSEYDCYMRG